MGVQGGTPIFLPIKVWLIKQGLCLKIELKSGKKKVFNDNVLITMTITSISTIIFIK